MVAKPQGIERTGHLAGKCAIDRSNPSPAAVLLNWKVAGL